jgi:hypothetical protein
MGLLAARAFCRFDRCIARHDITGTIKASVNTLSATPRAYVPLIRHVQQAPRIGRRSKAAASAG